MKNKEMVTKINLRKNKITNKGAIMFANFLTHHDNSVVEFDLNRNKISRAGTEALIDALHGSIRITNAKLCFGNKVPLEVENSVNQELKSNTQIKKNI
jgi:hypothetical protein